ncbi:MAG TPA: dihydrolipoamide acetyltransferase family protein [Myxococcales bacterium]|nr:dihydrolipoamide acetyltransferase family protein [Myxococcales bacterium]
MPVTTVVMPQLGESVVEGTVVRWLVKPGQRIGRDEPLVEVATDKANTEIPSPFAGVVAELLAAEGAVVPVGGALARLDDSAQAGASAQSGSAAQPGSAAKGAGAMGPSDAKTGTDGKASGEAKGRRGSAGKGAAATGASAAGTYGQAPAGSAAQGESYAAVEASPVARNVAQEHGLDLASIEGSGPGGRITKADVLNHLENRPPIAPDARGLVVMPTGTVAVAPPAGVQYPTTTPPPPVQARTLPAPVAPMQGFGPVPLSLRAYKPPRYSPKDGDQVVPFDQRRRLIAEHMVYSKVTSPHVPCTAEVDMTALSRRREEWKKAKETGGKAPSYLVGICRATVQALAEFTRMNAVVQDESLIIRKDINLGVAVETEKGLVVPVIRKASEKSVLGLARAIDDLAERSRTGKVTADELSGGSFTVSNPGLKGNLFGAAIINQPQVGILRMGEIVKRAVVRQVDEQDAIVIRPMMFLTLSYDHRVIDGVTGNSFLHRVRELIEAAQFNL